jgi:hypothetical protein
MSEMYFRKSPAEHSAADCSFPPRILCSPPEQMQDTGALLLHLGQGYLPNLPRELRLDGLIFKVKSEFHVTLLGSGVGGEIRRRSEGDTSLRTRIESLIAERSWEIIPQPEFLRIRKDKKVVTPNGSEGILHAEAIIQRAEVPAALNFYQKCEELFGIKIDVPPLHISLYTHGDDSGIGLPSESALAACLPEIITPSALAGLLGTS